jgi:AraC-like DNA-binding protein
MIPAPLPPDKGIDDSSFGRADHARFWREQRHDGLECLTATFRRHRYRPHMHETYVVGVVEAGCEAFVARGVRHYLPAGTLCFVNPGEVHDGEPVGGGFSYRMSYPSVRLISEIAEELMGKRPRGSPVFTSPVVQDPEGYRRFRRAHRALEGSPDRLEIDETTVSAFAYLVHRHAAVDSPRGKPGTAPSAVARMRDLLEAHFANPIDLKQVAGAADLNPFHAIRLFRRVYGLTPHAYLTDVRVRRAEGMLRAGSPPADVASACGFCDQSHLNRVFKARRGVTPAVFAQS